MLTPNDLEVFIHCYCSRDLHPRANAPAVMESIEMLHKEGMIEGYNNVGGLYQATPKGVFWLKYLLSVPFPVNSYAIPLPTVQEEPR